MPARTVPGLVRVLLADDHPGVLRAVAELLEASGAFTVVAACADGAQAVAAARVTAPDIAVLDLAMPVLDGLSTTRALRAEHPGLTVLVLTSASGEHVVEAARSAGAAGLVVKGAAPGALPGQLLAVLDGRGTWPAASPVSC